MPFAKLPQHARGVIFDHDGTLVESEVVHCQCWDNVLSEYGASLNYQQYLKHYNGLPTLETAERIQRHFQIAAAAESLYQKKIQHLRDHLNKSAFPLMPGVIDTFIKLQQKGVPMAIASGARRSEVAHSVRSHKLLRYLKAVTTKDEVTHSKPAPDVYLLAAEKMGLKPEECIAVEDSDTGEASALNAGMMCIRLTPTPMTPWQCRNMDEAYKLMEPLIIGVHHEEVEANSA